MHRVAPCLRCRISRSMFAAREPWFTVKHRVFSSAVPSEEGQRLHRIIGPQTFDSPPVRDLSPPSHPPPPRKIQISEDKAMHMADIIQVLGQTTRAAPNKQARKTNVKSPNDFLAIFQKPKPLLRPTATSKSAPGPDTLCEELVKLLRDRIGPWSWRPQLKRRIQRFGFTVEDTAAALGAFKNAMLEDDNARALLEDQSALVKLWDDLADPEGDAVDPALTRLFFAWATSPRATPFVSAVSPDGLAQLNRLYKQADLTLPAENFDGARSMKRKIIMHVGPTNSGKTHNALRALAAARTGAYAGPLRLLAHEVWERLNQGQIVPAGVDPEADSSPAEDSVFDVGSATDATLRPTVRRDGNPKYARSCNMITGEEHKIVDEKAQLLSCTVEMLNVNTIYDVVVVDEIQLITDKERGGAWTSAVLGVCAKELHLCGEETAVPLIQELVKDTGDELIVNRYERLSPLRIADASLGSDIRNVRKGDCIVTFSRSSIFALKSRVERVTGMRCAVAYGALPPEIRSEQAALFNDPDSGYDVLIGSDAIGMGLNLKIKRIVLETTTKFDGKQEVKVSTSQIKQIAGRAGRYGLHGDSDKGGVATTLHDVDLPVLRAAMAAPLQPLEAAQLQLDRYSSQKLVEILPLGVSVNTLLDVCQYVARVRAPYALTVHFPDAHVRLVDHGTQGWTLSERLELLVAPIQLRNPRVAQGVYQFLNFYRERLVVPARAALRPLGLLETLEMATKARENERTLTDTAVLDELECLHRLTTLYTWMSFRNPVAWPSLEEVQEIKVQVELAMNWCLEGVAMKKGQARRDGRLGHKTRLDVRRQAYDKMIENSKSRGAPVKGKLS